MKGSIRQQSKTSWQITIDQGQGPDGKRLRLFETVKSPRKGDAQKRLRELLTNQEKGIYNPPGKLTLAEHLHNWLSGYVKVKCSARTFEGYQSIIEHHIIPNLGHVQLKSLQQQAIQQYYGKMSESLSPRTINHQHRVLSEALKWAVKQGYLGRNPCNLVDVPKAEKKKMRTLTPEEVEVLIDHARDNYYFPVIYTALNTGLRQAELLGLRWRDINLVMLSISVSQTLYKRGGVTIFKEPKTEHSRRNVAMTPKLALFLRDYKSQRNALYSTLGRAITLDDLVFTSVEGNPIDPGVLSHNFSRLARKAGLQGLRFHDLRHTFASLMLNRGAKPKVISEALGHASVAFTMDTYSHIIQGMQEDAMALLNEVIPDASRKNVVDLSRNLPSEGQ